MTPFFVYNVGYQTQQNTKGKSLLWITLYSIYLTSFKNNISKSAGLFVVCRQRITAPEAGIFGQSEREKALLWNRGILPGKQYPRSCHLFPIA